MPIYKTLVVSTCLIITAVSVAGSDNPFSRWQKANREQPMPPAPTTEEREQSAPAVVTETLKTGVGESTTPTAKPAVAFFSASAQETAGAAPSKEADTKQAVASNAEVLGIPAQPTPPQTQKTPVVVESLKISAPPTEVTVAGTSTAAEDSAAEDVDTVEVPLPTPAPAAAQTPAPTSAFARFGQPAKPQATPTAQGSGVQTAQFIPADSTNMIQQTAGVVQDDGSFADFLNSSSGSAEVVIPQQPAQFEPPAAFEEPAVFDMPEFAETSVPADTNFEAPAADPAAGFDFGAFEGDTQSTAGVSAQPVGRSTLLDLNSEQPVRQPAARVMTASPAENVGVPQTPRVTLRWAHHSEFNIGQECRSDLIVENTGTCIVGNVEVEAVLPDGLEVTSAEPVPTSVARTATWSFGELRPGQSRKIALSMIPRQQGDLKMQAFVKLTGTAASSISIRQPAIAVNVKGAGEVSVGQSVNYTIHVSNPGTGQARNVLLQAIIPEGLEHRQGRRLTIDIGTLNPGEERRARLNLAGVKGGAHNIAVRVIADGGLEDSAREVVSVTEPKLNIGVRGPTRTISGQSDNFEVIVVNEGNVDSANVRARYRVPAGYKYLRSNRGGKYNAADRTIDWFVGTLEPAQMKNFSVELEAVTAGEYQHQVGVISEHGGRTLAEHGTVVRGSAKLELNVVSGRVPVRVGQNASYEVRISNTGSSAAQNVGLSCEIPTGLKLANITAPSEYLSDSGVVIFKALPEIAPGETATFVITTTTAKSGQHSARIRVASESIPEPVIEQATINVGR